MGNTPNSSVLLGRVDRDDAETPAGLEVDANGVLSLGGTDHLLTIDPNGAGRTESCLIPVLSSYPGSVVVVDLHGEVYAATAGRRRAMGQSVVRLDPFGVAGPDADTLNPLDLLDGLTGGALDTACQDLADLIVQRDSFGGDLDQSAFGLVSAVIGYLSTVPERRTFDHLYRVLHEDDVVYNLAVVLDTIGKKIPRMSYMEIATFLQQEDINRSRLLMNVSARLSPLSILDVQASFQTSSPALAAMRSGAPTTVYLMLPPERLLADSVLLRVWIGTLVHMLLRGPRGPALLLLDHTAELGSFPLVESLLRWRRGERVRAWTFWHDVRQLRATHPRSWPEIVSGAGVVQVLGARDTAAAAEVAALLDQPLTDILALGPGEQLLRAGGDTVRARRLHTPVSSATGR